MTGLPWMGVPCNCIQYSSSCLLQTLSRLSPVVNMPEPGARPKIPSPPSKPLPRTGQLTALFPRTPGPWVLGRAVASDGEEGWKEQEKAGPLSGSENFKTPLPKSALLGPAQGTHDGGACQSSPPSSSAPSVPNLPRPRARRRLRCPRPGPPPASSSPLMYSTCSVSPVPPQGSISWPSCCPPISGTSAGQPARALLSRGAPGPDLRTGNLGRKCPCSPARGGRGVDLPVPRRPKQSTTRARCLSTRGLPAAHWHRPHR